jgi:hypothetical protein
MPTSYGKIIAGRESKKLCGTLKNEMPKPRARPAITANFVALGIWLRENFGFDGRRIGNLISEGR